MNLHRKLLERDAAGRPVGVGLIGAGKFGSMFLAQVRRTRGMHLVGIADLAPARAAENLARIGSPKEAYAAPSLDDAAKTGATHLSDDAAGLIRHPAIEVVIDATGSPPAADEASTRGGPAKAIWPLACCSIRRLLNCRGERSRRSRWRRAWRSLTPSPRS